MGDLSYCSSTLSLVDQSFILGLTAGALGTPFDRVTAVRAFNIVGKLNKNWVDDSYGSPVGMRGTRVMTHIAGSEDSQRGYCQALKEADKITAAVAPVFNMTTLTERYDIK